MGKVEDAALPTGQVQPEMPSQEYLYVSSSRLKELARFGREVEEFVPPIVAKKLRERFAAGGE